MRRRFLTWLGLLLLFTQIAISTAQPAEPLDSDYFYQEPEMEPPDTLDDGRERVNRNEQHYQQPQQLRTSNYPRAVPSLGERLAFLASTEATDCEEDEPVKGKKKPSGCITSCPATVAPGKAYKPSPKDDPDDKAKQLRALVQHLYIAQARVQLEATEIRKAQAVATAAQEQLEEAANRVRAITAALQSAQQVVAAAAIRAQTAQLQLAAHDQLLFAARQDVDALSSQVVALQAAEGIMPPRFTLDVAAVMDQLKKPLCPDMKPTAVPRIVPMPAAKASPKILRQSMPQLNYD